MKEELLNLLGQLISFESIEGNEPAKQECLDWIETTFFSKCDFKRHSGSIEKAPYLYFENPDAKWLWFAHMDVIPANPNQFTLQIDGDKAIGRGTTDMKGNSLPFLMAFRDVLEEGTVPPVSLLLTTDEETAGPTIPQLLDEGLLKADIAFTPDTGTTIVTEHKGVIWARVIAEGKGGHSAVPWKSNNPLKLLASAIQTLTETYPEGTENDWQMTVTPTQLEGSDAQNKIPDVAVCGIDIRYPPEIASSAQEVLDMIAKELPDGCGLEEKKSASPLQTDPAHPLVQLYKEVADAVTGSDTPIGKEHGATDARYFGERGIPAFLCGCEGGGLHANDEWVSIPSMMQNYEIMKRILEKYS